jgi:5-(carboxyamino)imidazole ribonucleotide synthase
LYKGLNEILKIDNAFVHIYGKQQTKPGRKMGHITVLSAEKADLVHKANKIKSLITVVSKG